MAQGPKKRPMTLFAFPRGPKIGMPCRAKSLQKYFPSTVPWVESNQGCLLLQSREILKQIMCCHFCIFFFHRKVNFRYKKARQFFSRQAKENAERRWTPPLVRSVSRFTRVVVAESVKIFWRDEDDDTNDDEKRFFFLRLYATCKKREKKKNDYFFHSWGYAVSRRGDNLLPVFVFLRPREDEKRCDDDDDENNETILWHDELFLLLDEK